MLLATVLVVVISAATVANAGSSSRPELHDVVIDEDIHHIGDDNDTPLWETTFSLRRTVLAETTDARLEFWLAGSDGGRNSFVLNGRSFALPDSRLVAAGEFSLVSKTLVSIPVGLLQAGTNTLAFESGMLNLNPPPENTYDDFDFGEIVLLLTQLIDNGDVGLRPLDRQVPGLNARRWPALGTVRTPSRCLVRAGRI